MLKNNFVVEDKDGNQYRIIEKEHQTLRVVPRFQTSQQENVKSFHFSEVYQVPSTKVIFRKYKDGEIIALFPEEVSDMNRANCMCYVHQGQHSSAQIDGVIADTKPATVVEYTDLAVELERRGYVLDIKKRYTYKMYEKRKQEWERLNDV